MSAVIATVTSAVLSLFVPPLAYVTSGTVVGLITLRKGGMFGLQTMAISMVVLLLFSLAANLPYQLMMAYVLSVWLPICALAVVLRFTESQGLVLVAAGLIASILIVSMYLMVDDVAGWWKEWLSTMLEGKVPDTEMSVYQEALAPMAVLFNALMTLGLMLNMVMSLLLARWWQARLFNKGAFRKEFYALRLPALVLPVSGVLVLLTLFASEALQSMSRDILFIVLFMYLIQGVSAVHRLVEKYAMSGGWLITMYCFLFVVPQIAVLIACLGMTDVYVNWRRKNNSAGLES